MTEKVSRFNPLVYVFIVYQCQVFNIGQSISKSKGFTGCHIKNIDSIKNELTTSTLFILHGKNIYIYIKQRGIQNLVKHLRWSFL